MKRLFAATLLSTMSLSPSWAAVAADGNLLADEQEVIDVFRPMIRVAEASGMTIRVVVDASAARGASPAYMAYKDGGCSLILALRDNVNYQAVLATRGSYSRKAKLRAMLAHELGHCFTRYFEARNAGARGLPLPPLTREELHDDEVRADLFSMAWAAVYNPEEFDEVYNYLWELRFELSEDRTHAFASKAEFEQGLKFGPGWGYGNPGLLVEIATKPASRPEAVAQGSRATQ